MQRGELATLLWPEPQRRLVEPTATMTLVEGYAEHVMDAVGDQLDPATPSCARALDRDRERRGLLDSIVSRVLGLEMKLAQYRRGKAFCDEVVARARHRGAEPRLERAGGPARARRSSTARASWVERVGAARDQARCRFAPVTASHGS